MMQATQEPVKTVAEAVLGDVAVEFRSDGSATMAACLTVECSRCGTLHDHEGEAITLAPDQAWGLLQALRPFIGVGAYREAAQVIRAAIEGPQEGEGAEIVWDEEGHEWVIG
jgi:hypothetical protein